MKKAKPAPRIPYQPPEPCRQITVSGEHGGLQASLIHVWRRQDLADETSDGPLTHAVMAHTLMSASPAFQQVALILTRGGVPMLIAGDNHDRWWDVAGKAVAVQDYNGR